MPDDSFKEFVLDQLAALPEVRARAMFGAQGLYQADRFFGILDEGRVFFKVNESSRAPYVERGMGPFTYEAKGKTMTMSYYEVPPEVLENAAELVDWARKAVQVAASGKAGKKPASPPARSEKLAEPRSHAHPRPRPSVKSYFNISARVDSMASAQI